MENMNGENNGFQQSSSVYGSSYHTQSYGQEPPISTGKWVGIQLIKFIPFVGWIVYLVFLFIWAFGSDPRDITFRNWAKSNLILTLISVVLAIIISIAFGALIVAVINSMDPEMFNQYPYHSL